MQWVFDAEGDIIVHSTHAQEVTFYQRSTMQHHQWIDQSS